tara:strand:- start:27988 stop:28803 length:816 start_codon:yes stop_codon:yes gene_type:complete
MAPMQQPIENTAQAIQERVDAFVRSHFHLAATLRLHRVAFGWDLLRAPINVALAPVFLLVGLAAVASRLAGFSRLEAWLKARQIFLKTSVARVIEADIATDLLEGATLTPHSRALITDYTGVRSAVAEITTSLFVLLAGLLLFGTATPGVTSLTPKVSEYVAHASAVAHFPLGSGLGSLWYGVFPLSLPIWFVVLTGVALAMTASLVTTFAGCIADPIQARLGIHRRRLIRLVERISMAEGQTSGLAPEHILARLADFTDAGISLLRFFRS